jgi:uncharacterized protein YdeI (YjbR/CyaY-like superfamily)
MTGPPGKEPGVNTFTPTTTAQWREWLDRFGQSEPEIWLVLPHKDSATPGLRYHEAIEHALCFGWIDSHARSRDADSSLLRFTPRRPGSRWSAVNRERAVRLIEQGLMTERGQALIDLARATGTWEFTADELMPDDLRQRLAENEAARTNFDGFPPSSKRLILEWIATAKRPETRRRRIDQTVTLAAQNIRANHPGRRRERPADHEDGH